MSLQSCAIFTRLAGMEKVLWIKLRYYKCRQSGHQYIKKIRFEITYRHIQEMWNFLNVYKSHFYKHVEAENINKNKSP